MEHHAYLLVGSFSESLEYIPSSDRDTSPDVLVRSFERLGIDDARELALEASRTPVAYTHRVSIVHTMGLTEEAQNALLKLFEEPPPTARFYLIIPSRSLLLPTLLSRLHELDTKQKKSTDTKEASEFRDAKYADRLRLIESHNKDEDASWFRAVLDGLEYSAEKSGDSVVIRDIIFIRSYLGRPGASKKMLFEHLALSLPLTD